MGMRSHRGRGRRERRWVLADVRRGGRGRGRRSEGVLGGASELRRPLRLGIC